MDSQHRKDGAWSSALIATLLIIACALTSNTAAQQSNVRIVDPLSVNRVLDSYVDSGQYPFLYARLKNREGRVIYEYSAVNDTLLPGVKIDGQTWMRIWSMSKIVTISIAMDLIEEGTLGIDDPITDYLPWLSDLQVAVDADGQSLSTPDSSATKCPLQTVPVQQPVTVRHLLNHTAGFAYALTGIPCLDERIADARLPTAKNTKALAKKLADVPLIQQPGERYYYGTNTTVLGMVVERAAKKSLQQLVKQRINDALGIRDLRYGLPDGDSLLPQITLDNGTLRLAEPGELDIFGEDVPDYDPRRKLYLGGEGMLATANGYANFLRMLLGRGALDGRRFLDEQTVEDMAAPHTQLDAPDGHNGYNLWVTNDNAPVAGLWQGGGYEGTHFWVDNERGFVAVLMSQIHGAPNFGKELEDAFHAAVYATLAVDP